MSKVERVRIEIGFHGGQVVAGLVDVTSADQLERALHEDGPRLPSSEVE